MTVFTNFTTLNTKLIIILIVAHSKNALLEVLRYNLYSNCLGKICSKSIYREDGKLIIIIKPNIKILMQL